MPTDPTGAANRLRDRILDAVEQYDAERTDSDTHDDPLSRSYLEHLAKRYDVISQRGSKAEQAQKITQKITAEFSLLDVRVLRMVADALAAAVPAIVTKHAAAGMEPPQIAEKIALTPSRVYSILREQRKAEEVQEIIAAGVANDPDPHASYKKYEKALANADGAEDFLAAFRAALPDKTTEPPTA
ncbi:hypothetical protein RVR_10586 [Actinacidiphila reveromycinica]|uniref:Uncharacterized protein n=2 Tax=Actinacidiphila reveromycinica TaxID=659352 RepID=A0A7U3VRF2_9ACTN|nr:hypothetical protein RVR_7720 [Streptomyces sp. SN-593]BBB00640.1 hypothetical protein RVR_10586 [Streptomyces sp. SN-593]